MRCFLCFCLLPPLTVEQETLTVQQGRLGYWIGHDRRTAGELGPGETLTIPAGVQGVVHSLTTSLHAALSVHADVSAAMQTL